MKKLVLITALFYTLGSSGDDVPCTRWDGACSGIHGPYYEIRCFCDDVLRAKECGWTADPEGRHRWCAGLCLPEQESRTAVCCHSPCGTYHGRRENQKKFFNATDGTAVIINFNLLTSDEKRTLNNFVVNSNVTIDGFNATLEGYGVPVITIPPHSSHSYDASAADLLQVILFYKEEEIAEHDNKTIINAFLIPDQLGIKLMNNNNFVITAGSNNRLIRTKTLKRVTPEGANPIQRLFHNTSDCTVGAIVLLAIESEEAAGCKDDNKGNSCVNIPMPTYNEFLMNLGKGVTAFKEFVHKKYGSLYKAKKIQYLVLNPYDELDHTHDTGILNYGTIDRLRIIAFPYPTAKANAKPLIADRAANSVGEMNISTGDELIRINGVDASTVAEG